MSVDWSRYSSAEQTQQRARKPSDNAVVQLNVGTIRAIQSLAVSHSPIQENRSHSDVTLPGNDEDLTEARLKLYRIADLAIALN